MSRSSLALRAVAVLVVSAGAAAGVGALTAGSSPPAPRGRPRDRAPGRRFTRSPPARGGVVRDPAARPATAADAFTEIHAGAGPPARTRRSRARREPAGGLAPRLVSVVPANGARLPARAASASGLAHVVVPDHAQALGGALIVGLRPIGVLRAGRPVAPPRTSSH